MIKSREGLFSFHESRDPPHAKPVMPMKWTSDETEKEALRCGWELENSSSGSRFLTNQLCKLTDESSFYPLSLVLSCQAEDQEMQIPKTHSREEVQRNLHFQHLPLVAETRVVCCHWTPASLRHIRAIIFMNLCYFLETC